MRWLPANAIAIQSLREIQAEKSLSLEKCGWKAQP
jgi:hypothetical protein